MHRGPRVGEKREAPFKLGPTALEVADQHQHLTEMVWGLEHEAGLIGGDLQPNAIGLPSSLIPHSRSMGANRYTYGPMLSLIAKMTPTSPSCADALCRGPVCTGS